MGLAHLPPTTEPAAIADHLRRSGYAIVDRLASPTTMDRFAAEATRWVDASVPGTDAYDGLHTRRTGQLIERVPTARDLIMHPTVLGTVGEFLGHASAFQLLLTQIISIAPGETAQKLHRDQMSFDLFKFPDDYHVQCNTMWALTDFTVENGGTRVIAGSSNVPETIAASLPCEAVEMERGSVLFYDGKVLHGGGANRSTQVRQGINLTYAVGWVRQEENQYLACDADVARTLDDDLLRIMGYAEGAFATGYVGDQLDPLAFLRGQRRRKTSIAASADTSAAHADFAATIDAD